MRVLWSLMFVAAAQAAVVDSGANGFTVSIEATIQAPPDEVYRKFVGNTGEWWDSRHTFSGDAHNFTIDARAGGCWCEKLSGGGTTRHFEFITAVPGKALVLSGALGPLQTSAATGILSLDLAPEKGGTKVTLTYAMSGYVPKGLNSWGPIADRVLGEQLERFKNFVEIGRPEPPKAG
jgi:uncharacterized protein YndB with AHSA1/START domain